MAMDADVRLLIGVARGGEDGDSEALIRKELDEIMKNINKTPLKVSVELNGGQKGKKSFYAYVQEQLDKLSTNDKFSIQISKMKLGKGALSEFKTQIGNVLNTLNLDKGTTITIDSKGIGEVKKEINNAGNAASTAKKQTAELAAQLEVLGKQKSSVGSLLSKTHLSELTGDELSAVQDITDRYAAWSKKVDTLKTSKEQSVDVVRAAREELIKEGEAISKDAEALLSNTEAAKRFNAEQSAAAGRAVVLKTQLAALSKQSSSINSMLSSERTNGLNQDEIDRLNQITDKYSEWAVKVDLLTKSKNTDIESTKAYREELIKEGEAIEAEITAMQRRRDAQAGSAQQRRTALNNQEAKIGTAFEGLAPYQEGTEEFKTVEKLKEQYTDWLQRVRELNTEKAVGAERADEMRSALLQEGVAIEEEVNKLAAAATEEEKRNAARVKAEKLLKDLTLAERKWSASRSGSTSDDYKMISKMRAELQANLQKLMNGDITVQQFTASLSNMNAKWSEASSRIRAAGENTGSFMSRINNLASKFTSWLTVSQIVMKLYTEIRKMISSVIEIDSAMTELKKVTDETSDVYVQFLDNATNRAKALGSTVADTVNATADFARLGYTIGEASDLADAAMIYKNVGDGIDDISEASESIISTMKAFGIEAEKSMQIVDKFNEVGNRFAISSKGVGEALRRSASALAAGNNTLDESIALITAANSVVQDPDVVGTAMKTLSMYLRAAKTEAEDAGESTEGMAESVSELRKEILSLTGGKVDIQLNEDTFKSTYQIIQELSAVWGELSDITRANLLEQLGGKRNANVLSSLIENFSVAEQAIETSANAAGSALSENEKYLESIEGHIARLKATFEELSTNLVGSDLVKGVVDAGTVLLNVLNILDKLIDKIGGLKTILGVAGWSLLISKADAISGIATRAATWTAKIKDGINAVRASGQTLGTTLSTAFAQATAGASKFQLTLGYIGAAIAVISIAVSIYKNIHKSTEELVESSQKLKETFAAVRTQTEENIDALKGLSDEFDSLSSGVDQYGRNISLSTDDYERYKDIVKQIVGISPELIAGYDKENGYLADKNRLIERAIALQEAEYQAELRRMTTTDKLADAMAGSVSTWADVSGNEELRSATSLSGSIWNLFGIDNRINEIPSGMGSAEFFARNIIQALGLGDVDEKIAKSLREDGTFNLDQFWEEYMDEIANAIQQHGDAFFDRLHFDELGFESQEQLDLAIENVKNAVNEYIDVEDQLAAANKDVSDQLKLVAESNQKYAELSDNAKKIVDDFVDSFGVSDVTTKSWLTGRPVVDDNAIAKVKAQINDFVNKITPAIQEIVDSGMSLNLGLGKDGSALSIEEYQKQADALLDEINSIEDKDLQLYVRATLGLDETASTLDNDIEKAIEHTKNLLSDSIDSKVVDNFLNKLSAADVLKIYYNISAEPGSLTIDELSERLKTAGVDWSKTVNVWDFSSMTEGLGKIETNVSSITSAMEKLRSGTKLTVSELANLALKYPDILKQSDLFADGTIQNQETMLNAVLGTYEDEYDALVDTKIAELKASNTLIEDQINLENEKKNKVIQIADLQSNGKIDSEKNYQEILNQLKDLEGQNYVTFSDGVLSVNQDMLERQLQQEAESFEESKSIWGAQGDMIVESTSKGLSGALSKYPAYLHELASWAGTSLKQVLSNIGTNIKTAFTGGGDFIDIFSGVSSIGNISAEQIRLETKLEAGMTIGGKSVDEWSTEYNSVISKRVETLTEQIAANKIIIDNLTKLKGLDLTSLYGADSKSSESGSSKTKEYIADIDEFYEALKRLEGVQIRISALQSNIEYADSEAEKIATTKQLVNVYHDEADALEKLNALRKAAIERGKTKLEAQGFRVDYNADADTFVVKNMEHLNQLYGSTQTETNELRKETEQLIDTLEELNQANQDGASSLRTLRSDIREAKQSIIDALNQIVSNANEIVDAYQNVYDTLHSAADEYSASGYIMVDTLQSILGLGAQYMQYLMDENGLLIINEDSINRVIAAKTQELAIDQAMSYVERLRLAMQKDSIEDLNELLYATKEATGSTWGLVYANLALLNLDDDQYQAALHNINAIRSLADTAINSIGMAADSTKNTLSDMQSGVDDILKYVMDMLKQRINDQIDALNDMKDAYSDIIGKRKEALDAAKNESEYQDKVAEKVKSIAKLQERINALSLDNSREANAQRAKLQEEMAELQKELSDTQADHATDAQKDALDKMQQSYEDEKDQEIKVLEDSISSYQKLYDKAIDYIQSHWDTLYGELIDWNYQYGTELNDTITTAWENALAAAQRYGGYVNALNSIGQDLDSASNTGANYIVGDSTRGNGASNEDMIHAIVKEMYQNSNAYYTASQEDREALDRRNIQLGSMLSQYGVNATRKGGAWYVDGELLYEKYKKYIYHTGGVAGDHPSLQQNEILSVLEKGEMVLDAKREGALYRILQFATNLSDRFSAMLSSSDLNRAFAGAQSHLAGSGDMPLTTASNNGAGVVFGDVYIYGANDDTVERHKEINRQFTNDILRHLNIKR